MNGKARKLRINIKDFNKSKICLKQKENDTASSITRSCRIPFKRLCTFNNNISHEQCKVNANNRLNKNIEYKTLLIDDKFEANCKNFAKAFRIISKKDGEDSDLLKSMANNTLATTKPQNITKRPEEKGASNMIFPNGTHKRGNIRSKRTVSTKPAQNQDLLSSCTTKRSAIKLQRVLPTKKKTDILLDASSAPNTNRRCIVRLQRTPIIAKPENVLVEPSSTYKTRNCVVRIPKTLISKRNVDIKEFASTNNFSSMPVIDDSIRNNFGKLSLTKSLSKMTENKKPEKLRNSNLKNGNEEIREAHINNNKAEIPKNIDANNELKQLVDQKIMTNHKETKRLKSSFKLSLKRRSVINNKNVTVMEGSQFESQQNSSICFEPIRNSTLLDLDFRKRKGQENAGEETTKTTSYKEKSSSQNLANKSEEIENLLNSLDGEDEIVSNSIQNRNENQKKTLQEKHNISNINDRTNKFFHHKRGNVLKELSAENKKFAKPQLTKKRRFRAKRSTVAKRDNIYEFLSQSQTSDSDSAKCADPTADIIKKLIDQGKVRVATTCKGKGRPKFKRNTRRTRHMKKVKQADDKKSKQLENNTKKVTFTEKNTDDFCEDRNFVDDFEDVEIQGKDIVSNKLNNHDHKNLANDQDGTFSRLARTVLINQTRRSNVQRKNSSTLLEIVKKIVSTPKNTKIPLQTDLETDLSPIAIPPPRSATMSSPWRINEDAYLPKTFNFSRSSENLPSFSSDIIPLTPRKEKPKMYGPHQTGEMTEKSPTSNQNLVSSIPSIQTPLYDDNQPQITILNQSPLMSSFSSNDSNAENMPPRYASENYSENDNIFDLKQLPNPRKALNYRSPLKTINILDVVHLPPYKPANKTANTKEVSTESVEIFGFEENLGDVSFRGDQNVAVVSDVKQNYDSRKLETRSKEYIYGFEDYLSQTELSSQEENEASNDGTVRSNQNLTIHEKLQDLRKLKPDENELKKLKENSTNPILSMSLFNYDASKENGMRQRGIKEMLCPTVLDTQPSTSKEALKMLNNRNLKDSKRLNYRENLDLSELFKDPDPETTFIENEAHRTYIRPHKRKRRLNENNYILILESDQSGDEDDSHKLRKHHDSREYNTSSEQSPKKKRNRKEPKENKLLADCIEEFEQIVKEVNEYEMVVEKAT